jgi:hypothetical protein
VQLFHPEVPSSSGFSRDDANAIIDVAGFSLVVESSPHKKQKKHQRLPRHNLYFNYFTIRLRYRVDGVVIIQLFCILVA